MVSLALKSRLDELPLKSIKSFSKVNFKKESFIISGFKVERMNYFLHNDNIRGDVSISNEGSLSAVDCIRQMRLNSVG
jgi:hypothetical protein